MVWFIYARTNYVSYKYKLIVIYFTRDNRYRQRLADAIERNKESPGTVKKGADLTIHCILLQLEDFRNCFQRYPEEIFFQVDGGIYMKMLINIC